MPGKLFEEPFIDFSASRNRVLELAKGATDFVLMMDGDQYLEAGDKLRSFCQEHKDDSDAAYAVRIKIPEHETYWYRPFLTRTNSNCYYMYKVHEQLSGIGTGTGIIVSGVTIIHDPTKKNEERSKKRWEEDLKIYDNELAKDPDNVHYMFYLAQTYQILGDAQKAYNLLHKLIKQTKKKVVVYSVYLKLAQVADVLQRPFSEKCTYLYKAHQSAPDRVEPLVELAKGFLSSNNFMAAYRFSSQSINLETPFDLIPVDERVYSTTRYQIHTLVCFYLKKYDEGIEIMENHFSQDSTFYRCYMPQFQELKKKETDLKE